MYIKKPIYICIHIYIHTLFSPYSLAFWDKMGSAGLTCAAWVTIVTWSALVTWRSAVVGPAVAVARGAAAGVERGPRITGADWQQQGVTDDSSLTTLCNVVHRLWLSAGGLDHLKHLCLVWPLAKWSKQTNDPGCVITLFMNCIRMLTHVFRKYTTSLSSRIQCPVFIHSDC